LKRAGRSRDVPDEELDPILIQVTVPLPIPMIFSGLIDPAHLTQWLCARAQVEPRVGGAYMLAFEDNPKFTSDGRIV
jgi:uncharacterized protein YndB with AHSA1/START domain